MTEDGTTNNEAAEAKAAEEKAAEDKANKEVQDNKDTAAKKEKEDSEAKAKQEAKASKEFLATDLVKKKDSKLTDEHVSKVVTFAKEQGLSKEQAQAQLDRDAQAIDDFSESQQQVLDTKVEEWKKTLKDDKAMGGENLKATEVLTMSVIKRFATPEFNTMLDETGFGNHPEVVRFLLEIGKSMTPEQLILAGPGGNNSGDKKTAAQMLYGNTKA